MFTVYILTLNYGNSLFKTLVKMKIIPENTGQKVTHVKKKKHIKCCFLLLRVMALPLALKDGWCLCGCGVMPEEMHFVKRTV